MDGTTVKQSHSKSRFARSNRPIIQLYASGAVVILFVLTAIFGPMITRYDPIGTDTTMRLLPPGSDVEGSFMLFGTDQLGRSLLDQVIQGARISLLVAVATILLGGAIGTIVGLVAGYRGGVVDNVLMRVADIQLGIPSVLLAILIAGVIGPSVTNVIITLAITRWPIYARVVRGSTMATAAKDFIDSARVIGVDEWRILRRYIFPSVLSPLLVVSSAQVGLVIVAEASLSFLGLGVPLEQSSWGATISNGRDYLSSAWWISTLPGVVLVVVVVAIGFMNDSIIEITGHGAVDQR